ncbi:hypothetical protein D3C79_1062030 [compost metagenome]
MAIDVSIGSDSKRLVRLPSMAMRAALAFLSSSTAMMPRARFWFGQITPQTFRNMMMASQTPIPIRVNCWSPAFRPPARPKVRTSWA